MLSPCPQVDLSSDYTAAETEPPEQSVSLGSNSIVGGTTSMRGKDAGEGEWSEACGEASDTQVGAGWHAVRDVVQSG